MTETTGAAKLKVFISYSRRDCSAFALDLLAGLELVGFAPFLDRHDIAAGEDWEARLSGLIQASDTVVYVISPEAVTSSRCAWEIEKAIALAKRIIPVVAIAAAEGEVPAKLKQINYIFFNEPHTFARSLDQLAKALRTDLDWIREHTRIAELAQRWQQRGRVDALLLRGPELDATSAWMARWKAGSPEVTDLHRAFISASTDAETARASKERQQLDDMAKAQAARAEALVARESAVRTLSRRTTIGLASAGALTTAAAGLAYWGVDAEGRFRAAREQAAEAEKRSAEEAIRREAAREDIEGQLSAYAAAPGGVAMDGPPGQNSPFTKAVLKLLEDPNVAVAAALTRAAKLVLEETGRQQRPYLATDMGGELYLRRQPTSRLRKALVFSVDQVDGLSTVPLVNAVLDAKAWEALLTMTGFEVQRLVNPKKADVLRAIDQLGFDVVKKQGSVRQPPIHRVGAVRIPSMTNTLAAIFFSGFGLARGGENYLALADSKGPKDEDIVDSSLSVTDIQEALRRKAAASLLILDTNFERIQSSR